MYGERLKHYRMLRKMSQEALAGYMGFPPNTISKIEHGARKVTFDEAMRFAEILGISLNALAGMAESEASGKEDPVITHHCARLATHLRSALAEVEALAPGVVSLCP